MNGCSEGYAPWRKSLKRWPLHALLTLAPCSSELLVNEGKTGFHVQFVEIAFICPSHSSVILPLCE